MRTRLLRRRRRDERGSLTVFTVFWALVILSVTALAIDGGLAIAQRERAADLADQAARTEAENLDQGALRGTGQVRISGDDHCSLAASYLAGAASSVRYGTAALVTGYSDNGCRYTDVPPPVGGAGGPARSAEVTVEVQLTYSPFVFDLFTGPITVIEQGTAFAQAGA